MGWFGFGSGEKSDGETGKVSDVQVNTKTDRADRVTDVLVARSGDNAHKSHDHYYEKSNGFWGKSSKGKS
ncbi:hypothetical protein [Dongia sp.]|uniref:hypothetical protein n=1 Tax=Dongia sp. TaxID=1977262 RepID=UPI0035ADDA3F